MGIFSKLLPTDSTPKWQTALLMSVTVAAGFTFVYYLTKKEKTITVKETVKNGPVRKEHIRNFPENKLTPTQKAEKLKEIGNDRFRSGHYDEAVDSYTKAIEICPVDEQARKATYFQNRAAAYERLNNLDQIIADSTASLELNNRYTKAMLRRAKAAEKKENYDLAMEDLATACLIEGFQNPTTVYELDRVAKTAAHIEAEKFIASHPPKLPSRFFIQTYFSTFRNSKSLDKIDENDDRAKELTEKYLRLEKVLQQCGHIVEDCNALIKKCEDAGCDIIKNETLLLRATFYVLSKQNEKALEELDGLISMKNVDPRVKVCALIRRATLHQHSGDAVKRDLDFKTAIEIDGNNADVYHHLGQIYLIMDQPLKSVENFRKAVKLDDKNATTVVQLCYSEYKYAQVTNDMDSMSKYLKEFDEVMKKFPASSEAITLYAQVLVERQDYSEAEKLFNQVIQNTPDNSALMVHKALLMLQWKADVAAAKDLIQKAIELDSDCEFAYETIATIEMQTLNFQKAADYYYEAVQRYTSKEELFHLMCVMLTARAQVKAEKRVGPVNPAIYMGSGI